MTRRITSHGVLHNAFFSRATCKNEATVAITTFDKAAFVYLHIDSRVAEAGGQIILAAPNVSGTVTPDARSIDEGGFGHIAHGAMPYRFTARAQSPKSALT